MERIPKGEKKEKNRKIVEWKTLGFRGCSYIQQNIIILLYCLLCSKHCAKHWDIKKIKTQQLLSYTLEI